MNEETKAEESQGDLTPSASRCYLPISSQVVDEDQFSIDQAKIQFPELFERSIPFNIPAKIIVESTPSSHASSRIEQMWLGR